MHKDGLTGSNNLTNGSENTNGYSDGQGEEKNKDGKKAASNAEKENKHSAPSNQGKGWLSTLEEPSIARVQQFIIDTLKNPVRFIASQQKATEEIPYKPINDSTVLAERKKEGTSATSSPSIKEANRDNLHSGRDDLIFNLADGRSPSKLNESPSTSTSTPTKRSTDLYPFKVSLHPPKAMKERGAGLNNRGNTCYMNSTLQCLLHLPPLANALLMLDPDQLYGRLGARPTHKFDAIGEMAKLAKKTILRNGNEIPIAPNAFIADLKLYARTLVKYRQEDAHEFLRFLLEAMQFCSLIKAPKSLKPFDPIRETTLIHKIFGGKLRSRVTCERCHHNSDTYDTILDLSLDIRKSSNSNLAGALEHFTSTDYLSGTEKYKCEKCKMSVNATKRFTIHQAPPVLTIHLKRFTLTGQKITKQIGYGEDLTLNKNVLSEGQPMQKYKLHSVIHHHGSGPNSGHYIASVRGSSGKRWYEMNDSSVHAIRGAPVSASSAYVLFYVRAPGNALDNALHQPAANQFTSQPKKRRFEGDDDDEDEDEGSLMPGPSRSNGAGTRMHQNRQNGNSTANLFQNDDDDDDLGEAVANTYTRDANDYESLLGQSASNHQAPLSKKQRRRMRISSSKRETPEKQRSNFVSSPFMASSRNGGNNRFDNGKIGSGHRESFAGRMKNKQGARAYR